MSCYPIQLPTMVAENKAVGCTLKFKVTTKGLWNVKSSEGADGHKDRLCVGGNKRPQANVLVKTSMPENSGKRRPEMCLDGQRSKKQKADLVKEKSCESTERQSLRFFVGGSKSSEERISVKPSMTVNSNKQRPEISWKKQKMDRNLKSECSKILKELMNHSLGWVFSEPVDPVKLKIPDYLEIIRNPMDLGTIKRKLEGNMYCDAKEFADDVRLTFENAKSYNPPSHDVHRWAEILDGHFSRRWKLLDTKLKLAHKNDAGVNFDHHTISNGQGMKPVGPTKAAMPDKLGHSRCISLSESQKPRPGQMQVKPGKTALNGCSSLNKTVEKEHCNRRPSTSANRRQSVDSAEARCSSCVSWTCRCPKNSAAQTSATASDISSERSSDRDHCADSKLDCEVKGTLASHANGFALDLDGPAVALSEEKSSRSTSATTPVSVEGWMDDIQMSPRKALRAAMLKSRFADTIFKATHPTLREHGNKCDLSTMQEEKLRLQKEQLKEKARIAAQVKAAEEATRRKVQDDLKMRRETERKAARMALEKIERTVELDRSSSILKDLEKLIGLPVRTGYPSPKPLEQLGLYMKDQYLEEEEDEDAILNGEEGEILS